MKTLKFIVKNQKISKDGTCDFKVQRGTENFIKCQFQFDSSWDGFEKVAVFMSKGITDYVKLIDNKASLPFSMSNKPYYYVRVIGSNGKAKILTSRIMVKQDI